MKVTLIITDINRTTNGAAFRNMILRMFLAVLINVIYPVNIFIIIFTVIIIIPHTFIFVF